MRMASFLTVSYDNAIEENLQAANYEYRNKPFANSPVYNAHIEDFELLSEGIDVKTVYRLKLSLQGGPFDFAPGDVIAILPNNNENEVIELLSRLNLQTVCHQRCLLDVVRNTTKKSAVPKHLPRSSTLHEIFLKHIDIRTVPKKGFLKNLIKYTTDEKEKGKLELVCSPSGSKEYIRLVEDHRSLLSLFNAFSSCHPPVELILEYSTPLNPRYFSIASSPLSNSLSIMFFVLELENGLKGVCTSWLKKMIDKGASATIPLYFRKPGNFQLQNLNCPVILVATGTGLAPFLSFLEDKKLSLKHNLMETWLFYGCRYSTKDFLCQEELTSYLSSGILTKLYTAFSRENEEKVYVQHLIRDHKEEITELILNKEALICVCGNVKTVVKDVKEVIVECFMVCRGVDRKSAEDLLAGLINKRKFLIDDSWL